MAAAHEFWRVLEEQQCGTLREIFGAELHDTGHGRHATPEGRGQLSLGCLRPAQPPELVHCPGRDGKTQIRLRFTDGQCEVDAGVTDLRLYGGDHAAPDAARVRAVAQWLAAGQEAILSLGLTRKYRPSDRHEYQHWLQVNNIHFKEDPVWQLG